MVSIKIHKEEQETEKWVKHYSSNHQILIVGDGDFSFSLSLATSFRSASNITATSLDTYDTLTKKYKKAPSNLESLQKLGASVIHGIDATRMKLHTDLTMRRFDRIVYNFPHAGFHGKEDSLHLIKKHKGLVQGFFRNASGMLRPNGEIHVSHKTSAPFCDWNLKELAYLNSLMLIECAPFRIGDYPGYNNKRGDGKRSDEPFPLGECSTFKFILDRGCKKLCSRTSQRSSRHIYDNSVNIDSELLSTPERNRIREEFSSIFDWYFDHVRNTFGVPDESIQDNVDIALILGYDRFVDIASGRPLSDFVFFLEELHRLSISRIQWLEGILEVGN